MRVPDDPCTSATAEHASSPARERCQQRREWRVAGRHTICCCHCSRLAPDRQPKTLHRVEVQRVRERLQAQQRAEPPQGVHGQLQAVHQSSQNGTASRSRPRSCLQQLHLHLATRHHVRRFADPTKDCFSRRCASNHVGMSMRHRHVTRLSVQLVSHADLLAADAAWRPSLACKRIEGEYGSRQVQGGVEHVLTETCYTVVTERQWHGCPRLPTRQRIGRHQNHRHTRQTSCTRADLLQPETLQHDAQFDAPSC